jgi:hypothetical protein
MLEMLIGAGIFAAGVVAGRFLPNRRRGIESPKPQCSCGHAVSFHGPDGRCSAMVEVTKWDQGRWQGNVRELENTVHRAVLMASGDEIGPDEFHPPFPEVVDEYLGAGIWKGNREAYLIALENATDASRHSMLNGKGPAGAVLRLVKQIETYWSTNMNY